MAMTTIPKRRPSSIRASTSSPRSPGVIALFGAASFVGGDYALSLARLQVGAFFLGAVSDAMLLGHWYLVQPGLGRDPIRELVKAVAVAVAVRSDRVPHPRRDGRRCSTAPSTTATAG